ncbi:MAG: hypothetical protein N3J91_07105 [Verrucomicrobiae bacterium]|nr:hypothetical protein [Verrucomicrobiae bacterium]
MMRPLSTAGFKATACLLAAALIAGAGCGGSARRQAERDRAFAAGMEQARQQMQAQQAVISFRGPVKNPVVPWTEGLTLTEALLQAEVTTLSTPRNLMLIRKGQVFQINPRRLLQGQENVTLEPGDVIEVVR